MKDLLYHYIKIKDGELGYKEGDFPVAEEAAREVLALPIYPELTSDQQDFIVSSIQSFYKG